MSNSESSDLQGEDFASALAEYEKEAPTTSSRDTPEVGDTVSGKIVSVGREAVFVALGTKAEGMLELDQVTGPDGAITVAVGDTIEARVAEIQAGTVVLRTSMGRGPDARAELEQAHQHGIPVDGLVTGVNKGGLEVQIAGVRAFCPMSQIDVRFIEDPGEFVGQRLQFRISRYEAGRGGNPNIVVSRRVLMEEEAARRALETRKSLAVGATMSGKVTSIKHYGAFVDLGGIEGMVHISELGFSRVEHPGDVVSVGQEVDVQVIKIEKTGDPKRPEKIALSIKALARDPWDYVEDDFPEGSRVYGAVVRLQPFGAFIELMPGIEGLIHISELGAGRRINDPSEIVRVGQEVEVTVLRVERSRRRIALSMAPAAHEIHDDRDYDGPPDPGVNLGTFADVLDEGGRGRRGRKKGRRRR